MKDTKNEITFVKLEQLRSALVRKLSAEYSSVGARLVYQTVNEALALASATRVPLLVMPLLAEEKVQRASAWAEHQRAILHAESYDAAA